MIEEETLKRAQDGDLQAIEEICSSTWEAVYRFIYFKVQNRQEAEDITQDTYVKALSHFQRSSTRIEQYISYLKAISLNILRDKGRMKKRRGILVDLEAAGQEKTAVEDPAELTAYNLPDGYQEIDTNPEQLVSDMQEAGNMAGFTPKVPYSVPEGYNLDSIAVTADKTVKLNYAAKDNKSRVIFLQGKAQDDFKPASKAVLGKLNNYVVEIQSPVEGNSGILTGGGTYAGVTNITSMRWQENGFEYAVVGNASLEELTAFVNSFTNGDVQIPQEGADLLKKPQIEVPADMEIEKNDQKRADDGHSPWKLDPVFVAQVFISLKISPEGITGDYPIKYEDLKATLNTGSTAVVEAAGGNTPVRRVYLKKLIRQDSTGIWTVVGYDPAEE